MTSQLHLLDGDASDTRPDATATAADAGRHRPPTRSTPRSTSAWPLSAQACQIGIEGVARARAALEAARRRNASEATEAVKTSLSKATRQRSAA